jgi:hypothetical protein
MFCGQLQVFGISVSSCDDTAAAVVLLLRRKRFMRALRLDPCAMAGGKTQ